MFKNKNKNNFKVIEINKNNLLKKYKNRITIEGDKNPLVKICKCRFKIQMKRRSAMFLKIMNKKHLLKNNNLIKNLNKAPLAIKVQVLKVEEKLKLIKKKLKNKSEV